MDSLVTNNVRQRPVRTIVSVVGIALGVCLIMLFTGLSTGLSNELQRRSSNVRGEIIFTRAGSMQLTSSTANLSTLYVDKLKAIDGVADALPIILHIYQDNKGFGFEQLEGVDWEGYSKMNGTTLVAGRPPQTLDEIVIDEKKARTYAIGNTMKLFGSRTYRITGIYSPESGPRIKMSLAAMQDALEARRNCTYILVKCRNANEAEAVFKRIDVQLPGNKLQFTRDVFVSPEKSIPFLRVFLRTLVGLSAIVSALVVMLAMYTTITERTREIGILKALGASRGYIIAEIEREAILISVIGLIAGFVISFVAGVVIHRIYGLVFEYTWQWGLTAAIIGMLGGVVGALYPAVRASNLDPVNALAYE